MYSFSSFELDGDFIIAEISDAVRCWQIAATIDFVGNTAKLRGFHIQGPGPNTTGKAELRALASWLKGELNVDERRIEGATRTSGANPGRRPSTLVFR